MRKIKSVLLWPWLPCIFLMSSFALTGWSRFDKVQRERACQQQKISLDAIKRDCQQWQKETDEHYRKGKALIAKKPWSKDDLAFASRFSQESRALDARFTEIKRRYDDVCETKK